MTENLRFLLELYGALQDSPLHEQADRQAAFAAKVKEVAALINRPHWEVSAHVQKQWEKQCLGEDRRKGIDRGAGLRTEGKSA